MRTEFGHTGVIVAIIGGVVVLGAVIVMMQNKK